MKRLALVGILVASLLGRAAHAQESPDAMTATEDRCERRLAAALDKAFPDLVRCYESCLDPTLCFDPPPPVQSCVEQALHKFTRTQAKYCAGPACPECVDPGVCASSPSPFAFRPAEIAGYVAGQLNFLSSFDAGMPFVADVLQCARRCFLSERDGARPAGSCSDPATRPALARCIDHADDRFAARHAADCDTSSSCPPPELFASFVHSIQSSLLYLQTRLSCRDPQACGDGLVSGTERCDDGPDPALGCTEGETCSFCTSCDVVCGDGRLHPTEHCDPAAVPSGCGAGEACSFPDCATCSPVCGDGIVHPSERCDPFATPDGCGIGERCALDLSCGTCTPVCGDGIVHPAEACDPGTGTVGCADGGICTDDCRCSPPVGVSPIVEELAPCGLEPRDTYVFAVNAGQQVWVTADTVDPDTAADLCVTLNCPGDFCSLFAPDSSCAGDDELPCSFPPPQFACPEAGQIARLSGACRLTLEVCSLPCASAARARYRLNVTVDGAPVALSAVSSDAAP